jgi:serine/threonine protein kinase
MVAASDGSMVEQLEVGSYVERYIVERVLGAGGTAMVYLVRHETLGTRHALKVLTITSEGIRNRLITEGRVQGRLKDHPNIVAVYDVLDVHGSPGLVLDYVDGPSLETVLRQYRFGVDDAVLLFEGVLAGVQAAHDVGIAHRDLKPANVLLAQTKEGFVPKVTDFGLAKQLVRDQDIRATRQGVAMGTPSYMAPEQIRDAGTVDARADLFSLGCMLYELVTRRRTFPGDEVLPIYNAVTRGEYLPPRHFVPDLSDSIDVAIRGCLQVNRDQRIPDCSTLLEVLHGEREWAIYERERDEEDTEELLVLPPPVLSTNAPALTLAPSDVSGLLDPAATLPARPRAVVSTRKRRGAPRLVMGWAVVGLCAVGFAGWWWLGGRSGEEEVESGQAQDVVLEEPVVADTLETTAAMTHEEAVAEATPSPAQEPSSPPSSPATPATPRRVTPTPAPEEVNEPVPVEEPETQEPPVEEPVEFTVRLLSLPPTMKVQVGDEMVGRTNLKLSLNAGLHTVKLSNSGESFEFPIEVENVGEEEGKNRWCYLEAEGTVKRGNCR